MRPLILTLALALAAGPLLAAGRPSKKKEEEVIPPSTLKVEVEMRTIPPRHYHHMTEAELTAISSKELPGKHVTYGLTRFSPNFLSEPKERVVDLPEGGVHYWLDSLKVTFGCAVLDIFIAQEYARGTCKYEVALAHETEHVARNFETMRRYKGILKDELGRAGLPVKEAPLTARTAQEAREQVLDRIEGLAEGILGRFAEDNKALNAEIDTEENYARETDKCERFKPGYQPPPTPIPKPAGTPTPEPKGNDQK